MKRKKKTHRKPNQTMNMALLVWTSLVQLRKHEKASMAGAKPARVTVGGGEGREVEDKEIVQDLVNLKRDLGFWSE